VIVCLKCTKENQDHYKFCLGCGAELPRESAPKKFSPGTPPQGVETAKVAEESTSAGPGHASAPPPAEAAAEPDGAATPEPAAPAAAAPEPAASGGAASGGAAAPMLCPQCAHPNPTTNKFCASCGFKLGKAASASTPAPAADAAGAASAQASGPSIGYLTALRADGTECGTFDLPSETLTVGRDTGGVFAGDSYLSPRHATFTPKNGKLYIRDESSLNGVYRRLNREEPVLVEFGSVFRIGQEILKIEQLTVAASNADGVERLGSPSKGYVARMALVIGRDTTGNAYPIPESGLHLGRERGEVLFPEDGYVSGLHCKVSYEDGKIFVTDLGSSNGSFVRLLEETEIQNGQILLMGQQLFRVAI